MATTIRQIASAAGVSVATASRALNGAANVVDATRERVLAAAALLDYTPSRLGRSLATGSTGNIGVILPDVTNPFYTSFLAELESALGSGDRGILVGDSHEDLDTERALIRRMAGQVDALILASSRLPDADIIATAQRLPVILANRLLDASEVPEQLSQITLDIEPAFADAVRHLHALGHASVTYVNGPPLSWSGRQKRRSLETACAELRMPLAVVGTASPDFVGGRTALASLDLARTSAVIAFNDEIALGLLSALRDAGVDVPGRVSVIGCDDSLPAGLAWPSLTTVDSSARTLGALTATAIVDPKPRHTATVPTRLVVRDSTARASVVL